VCTRLSRGVLSVLLAAFNGECVEPAEQRCPKQYAAITLLHAQ
jgi:hypothetical protein